ncbi:septum site-determining protein MinC [Evansella cellulosilytica]|uniref:Probable septum site-determining protein MinC n=1 Tax=Evansella cellulosilytica (strain ATCC 21833 / DSM 2522 / FERM P-1141 / JCM 9156 / N-4) TaxID=649639 RepID=E6TYU8_EVAC2|nr:septum site-determining protein MinC [Evansella cellulosilytica]ADU31283.1 septum site-determining protein MinC [Evansella cellulosilytica DSM 2522]
MTSKQVKKQNVLIKGTKDGLTFFLNDQCTFDSLIKELQDKLSERPQYIDNDGAFVRVKLVSGKRYLEKEHIDVLSKTLSEYIHGVIDSIECDVVTKEEAESMKASEEITRLVKVVRSGQVIDVPGDLLLIGDVNPGGTVRAKGNIYILGKLLGIAHAGMAGNKDAIICASALTPSQLRIADVIRRPPEDENDKGQLMECAYVDESGEMVLDRLQRLSTIRPNISSILNN